MDTVDKVMRKLRLNELEELKVKLIRILLESRRITQVPFLPEMDNSRRCDWCGKF